MQSEQKKEILFAGLSAEPLRYQACILRAADNKITILKDYSVSIEETSWDNFVRTIEQDFPDYSFMTAMGFDDGCVGFYRFEVPIVDEKHLPAVIAAQAEIHLPLPIEQMQYGRRLLTRHEGKATVIVAAAKRETLSDAINQARRAHVDTIVLSSEAVLRSIDFLCDDLGEDFCLLRIRENDTKLFFVQNGILTKAVKFDCEFSATPDEQTSEASLLCLDIQNVIDEYLPNYDKSLCLFLDGTVTLVDIAEKLLNDKGVKTSRIRYDLDHLAGGESIGCEIECLGLALIAYDASRQYDLFQGLYHKENSEQKETAGGKKKVLAAAVCLMLAIFIAVSYGVDKFRLAAYKKQMNTPEFSRLLETHHLRGVIAQQRIDIPGLIEKINQGIPEGVSVQSLTARRFQKIVVGGSCNEPKRMYAFAEALGKCSGIEGVRILNQNFDEKKKQTTFTLTFDYKHFTDKRKQAE